MNDPVLDGAEPAHDAGAAAHPVSRRALYLGTGDAAIFGWYHHAARPIPRDCVAVICAPIGPDYTRSHRTIRHLADRLARAGVPALRFDYHGIGDSPGSEEEPDRIGHWRRSIATAVRHARRLSGCSRVCLVGVRLGATLAALEAADAGASLAVLWNPVIKGRAYARELQAIAMTAADAAGPADGALESAGFRIGAETLAALKAVDLTQTRFRAGTRVLLVGRDDLTLDRSLAAHLAAAGVAGESLALPGWNGMMADHQFTVVPDEALTAIVGWVRSHSVARPAASRPALSMATGSLGIPGGEEILCHFGADDHLFGVLTRPAGGRDKPAIVMLNAGSIHHVGPHRLYVRLARELAASGYPSLRLDHEGLGDSVLRAPGVENEPYAATAMQDLQAALAHLRENFGYTRFILLGLCSGAHTAFHAGRTLDESIDRLILINPWYFYWSAGMTYDPNCNHYENVAAYQKSMRDAGRWKRLLRGEVDLGRLARIAGAHAARKARAYWRELSERAIPSTGTQLSRDLRAILARGRRIAMFEADGEPAGAVMLTEARRTVARARRDALLILENVPGGDHTFSQAAPRDDLVRRVRAALDAPR